MSKIRYCEECNQPIRWDDDIIRVEDGDIYHEECCSIFPIMYGIMVDDDYKGNAEDNVQLACSILNNGEYIDIEDEAE